MLRILSGLQSQTSGALYFRENRVDEGNLHGLRQRATMIFQYPRFMQGDVHLNLAYGLRIRGIAENVIVTRIDDVLDLVSLSEFDGRIARSLSGGEQQRVALARAILLDPEVLILDEPTSNLDPVNSKIITDILLGETEKRTVIIATHDLDQVKRIAEHVIFLEDGVITEEGDPYEMDLIRRFTATVFTGTSRVEKGVSQVTVGEITIRVSTPLTGRVSLHVRPQDIIISKGWIETSGVRYPVPDEGMTIGRSHDCTVHLAGAQVSRRHARIDVRAGAFEITDLDSANGTTVNGRHARRQALHDGDEIDIGQSRLKFHTRRTD